LVKNCIILITLYITKIEVLYRDINKINKVTNNISKLAIKYIAIDI